MAREESELGRLKSGQNTGPRPLRPAPRLVDTQAPQWACGAARKATPLQWLGGVAACALLATGLVMAPTVVHHLLFGLFTFGALTRLAAAATPRLARAAPPIPDRDLPRYTVIAPLYREAAIAPDLVAALRALDYPRDRLQALIVLESDDSETWDALAALPLPAFIQVLAAPPGYPRTKPRACNIALERATGELVTIYDAEDGRPWLGWSDGLLLAIGWAGAGFAGIVGLRRAGLPIRPRDLLFLPLYWPLHSLAAGHALFQLFDRPFHWDKTPHAPRTGQAPA